MASRTIVDVNCDMGEGFGAWSIGDAGDDALLPLISSANIATGFHAGDPTLMDRLVREAGARGIGLGAHPGFRDLQGFGRRHLAAPPDELVNDVLYQVGALAAFARRYGHDLQHVKLHGALYMHAARDEAFSAALVDVLQRIGPTLLLYCMDVSMTCAAARRAGVPVVREFYADRDYDRSGSIVFARRVGRPDPARVADKVVRACRDGRVDTVEGDTIEIAFESVCFHSDTPGALDIATALRAALAADHIQIARPTASA
ncbi:MAG TPA: 5-oxoprolinase subunit PxpA [Acetobacteraceae bacterium]|nr:5-oxoprolinase subunit PxpA [Acetobacteraceae bacterium]